MEEAKNETASQDLRETGAVKEERELVELLFRHAREEGALLERYQRFAAEASSAETRYLVNLILDDERRHHGVLGEMANGIELAMALSPDPAVPIVTINQHDAVLMSETKELLAAEKRDRAELRRIRKRFQDYADKTLGSLLIDLMLADTDKHVRILTFVVEHNAR